MNRGLALVGGLCLVLGFQNCTQSSLSGDDGAVADVSVSLPSSSNAPSVGSADMSSTTAKVTYVEIPNVVGDVEGLQKASSQDGDYRLVVSTQTGVIQLMDESNESLQTRCLDAGSLQELKTILSGSSVCAKSVPDDVMCAMRYKPSYAALYANENRIKLGEEQDSCGRGQKDLCGGVATVFQAYIDHLRLHWTEMNCE